MYESSIICKFLKHNILTCFWTPRALISNRGLHLFNARFSILLENYRMIDSVAMSYHPQTSKKVEPAIKQIKRSQEDGLCKLHGLVNKLNDTLWAYHITFSTLLTCPLTN